MKLHPAQKELRSLADPARAAGASRYFKTGKGEYGEGDVFLGIRVPILRKMVSNYLNMPLGQVLEILQSIYHEERMFALLLMVKQFDMGDETRRKQLYQAYLRHTRFINNWDLVDCSAHLIVGKYLIEKDKQVLIKMAKSKNLWERRISILSTFYFVKSDQYQTSLDIALLLLNDMHDLIHKAVGWMLREIGNKDIKTEMKFLDKHYQYMPRTMLRYAIEKLPDDLRLSYLKGKRKV